MEAARDFVEEPFTFKQWLEWMETRLPDVTYKSAEEMFNICCIERWYEPIGIEEDVFLYRRIPAAERLGTRVAFIIRRRGGDS